jgi:hypothetical protein
VVSGREVHRHPSSLLASRMNSTEGRSGRMDIGYLSQ